MLTVAVTALRPSGTHDFLQVKTAEQLARAEPVTGWSYVAGYCEWLSCAWIPGHFSPGCGRSWPRCWLACPAATGPSRRRAQALCPGPECATVDLAGRSGTCRSAGGSQSGPRLAAGRGLGTRLPGQQFRRHRGDDDLPREAPGCSGWCQAGSFGINDQRRSMSWIQGRAHSAKKPSRSWEPATTWRTWPQGSMDATPNNPVQAMRARWRMDTGTPGAGRSGCWLGLCYRRVACLRVGGWSRCHGNYLSRRTGRCR